jgi:NADPH2:quinone reductase
MTLMNAMAVESFGPPENLKQTTVEVLEPGPGEVLVRIAATAVNPADLGMRDGRYPWKEPVRFPIVPGYDVAGIVEQGTPELPAGTAVVAFTDHVRTQRGSYAEYVTLPVELVVPAPRKLDWAHAAALPLGCLTARTALAALGLEPGQSFAVNGPRGSVGGFAVQLSAEAGLEFRESGPVDGALDVIGGASASETFARVRDGGRYATVVPEFWVPGGQFESARGIEPVTVFVDVNRDALAEMVVMADAGVLRPRVAEELPMTTAAEAHARLGRRGVGGKLVLVP